MSPRNDRSVRRLAQMLACLAAGLLLASCAAPDAKPLVAPPLTATPRHPPAADLALSEFYKMPVGPRGLEPTDKLLALKGQRVRIRGFMVREDEPLPGLFLLASLPVTMAERADGAADDLPAATVFVHLPDDQAQRVVAFQRGPIAVEGQLELGAFEEASERISYVRLRLDAPSGASPVGSAGAP